MSSIKIKPIDLSKLDYPVIWKAHAGPQSYVLKKIESEIFYGGARGGGKTDAGIVWIAEPVLNSKYRGLVIRRNSDDLTDWIDRAKQIYRYLGGEYINREFRFPSGAVIRTGHLADENAYERYQGHEYQRILIEELTHIPTLELYLKLIASNRSTVPELKPQVFCTSNPGGPGHRWVKQRFIDPMKMKKLYYVREDGITRAYVVSERFTDAEGNTRVFVKALVDDNPTILKYDKRYVSFLDSLPEDLRKMWREGEWEVGEVKGAYYTKQLNQARIEGRISRVPYDPRYSVDTYWDIGVGDSTAIGFVQQVGLEFRFIDYYENSGEGLPHYAKVLQERAKEKGYVYGTFYAPHDIEVREFTNGTSRKETAKSLGIKFKVVPKTKLEDGIEAVRNVFGFCLFDERNCERLLDGLANYRKKYNRRLNEHTDEPEHDWASHPADMVRYFALTNRIRHSSSELKVRVREARAEAEDSSFDPRKPFSSI